MRGAPGNPRFSNIPATLAVPHEVELALAALGPAQARGIGCRVKTATIAITANPDFWVRLKLDTTISVQRNDPHWYAPKKILYETTVSAVSIPLRRKPSQLASERLVVDMRLDTGTQPLSDAPDPASHIDRLIWKIAE
jgi:hypothetical protein